MSLDVMLYVDGKCVFDANITHNLNVMAEAAGIYKHLWRPEEIGAIKASHIADAVALGAKDMAVRPTYYKQFDSPNGWGLYENFLPWVGRYAEALAEYPDATIEVSR